MLINNPWLLYQHPENDCLLSKLVVRGTDIEKWNTRKPMDRILEQLEQRKTFYENRMGEGIDRDLEDWGSVKSYEDAIDIVKAGGV